MPSKSPAQARPISLTDAAYAAGFFDGEGCISIALKMGTKTRGRSYPNARRYMLSVSLSQNDPAPVRWLVDRFGGRAHFIRGKRSYDDGHYERWNWTITTKAAMNFLRTVRPFLIVKAEQADIAFEFAQTIVYGRRKTPPEVQVKRHELRERIREIRHAFRVA